MYYRTELAAGPRAHTITIDNLMNIHAINALRIDITGTTQLRNHKRSVLVVVLSWLTFLGSLSIGPEIRQTYAGPQEPTPIMVNVRENLERLLAEEDTDGDRTITIHDLYVQGSNRGDQRFWLIATNGKRYEIDRTYYLSNLLQELTLRQRAGLEVAPIDLQMVFEEPVHRISRRI